MHYNLGIQAVQRLISEFALLDEKEKLKIKQINNWLQKRLNEYYLSIYRYPLSRKPIYYYKYYVKSFPETESYWIFIKRVIYVFTGTENMMFAFFSIISSLSIGITASILFDFSVGIICVALHLLLGFMLLWWSLAEDRWLSHPKKNEYDKWKMMYNGLISVTLMLDVRGIPNEQNRK